MTSPMPHWLAHLIRGLGILALSLSFASAAQLSGIGGTGAPSTYNEGSGIGGTGAPLAAHEGSGIGGTGIVGVITAFGSIWVNGVEIHYSADSRILTPTGNVGTGALAIGQFVLVDSDRQGDQAQARSIQLLPSVAGPISAITPARDRVTVAGQTVLLAPNIVRAGLQTGDWVQVSGLSRSDGSIVATTIAPYPSGNPVLVYGVPRVDSGQLYIQALPVQLPATAASGVPLLVSGQLQDGVLLADQVRNDPINGFAAEREAVRIQGYVQATDSRQVTIGHLRIDLDEHTHETPGELAVDQLVVIEAHRGDAGDLVATHIALLSLDELGGGTATQERPGDDHSEAAHAQEDDDKGNAGLEPRENDHPETEQSEVEATELDTPEAENLEVETPEVEAPEVETPEVETPEVETPEVETPEVETPEVEAPEVEAPEVEAPEVEAPEVEVPEVETPEVEAPEVEVPEVEVPEVEVPEVEVPDMDRL